MTAHAPLGLYTCKCSLKLLFGIQDYFLSNLHMKLHCWMWKLILDLGSCCVKVPEEIDCGHWWRTSPAADLLSLCSCCGQGCRFLVMVWGLKWRQRIILPCLGVCSRHNVWTEGEYVKYATEILWEVSMDMLILFPLKNHGKSGINCKVSLHQAFFNDTAHQHTELLHDSSGIHRIVDDQEKCNRLLIGSYPIQNVIM